MAKSLIDWTGKVWNVCKGCKEAGDECAHCWAKGQAHRFSGPGGAYEGLTVLGPDGPEWTGAARFDRAKLGEPTRWRKGTRVFVNSMSDLYHHDITDEQIAAIFGVMAMCPQHTFQVLTKRHKRLREWFQWVGDKPRPGLFVQEHAAALVASLGLKMRPRCRWPLVNVHIGVSAGHQRAADERIPVLAQVPAAVRWVSLEPLLGPIRLPHLDRLGWVVLGGESGPGARDCDVGWLRSLVAQCQAARVPVFVKQLGARPVVDRPELSPDRQGSFAGAGFGPYPVTMLLGKKNNHPAAWPKAIQVREFPE